MDGSARVIVLRCAGRENADFPERAISTMGWFMTALLLGGLGAILAKLQNIEITLTIKLGCH
jgi:hypothetical protein